MKLYYAVSASGHVHSRHAGGKGYARKHDAINTFKVYARDPVTNHWKKILPEEITGKLYEIVTDFENMTSTVRELHPYTGEYLDG